MGKIYAGVGNVAEEVVKIYAGVGDVAKQVSKVYVGVNDTAKLIWIKPILPDAYRQVEYIQSSGTQYINTQVKVKTTTKISVDYQMTGYLSGTQGVMGMQGSSASHRFYVAVSDDEKQQYGLGNGYGAYTKDDDRRAVIIDGQNKHIYVNGDSLSPKTGSYSNFNNNNVNIEIFGMYSAYSSAQRNSACKVYSAKIYEAGVIVRDFYPCIRKSDDVVGMYDMVGEVFYTNAGTGTFTAGPSHTGRL